MIPKMRPQPIGRPVGAPCRDESHEKGRRIAETNADRRDERDLAEGEGGTIELPLTPRDLAKDD
jgi:hypothetical protein